MVYFTSPVHHDWLVGIELIQEVEIETETEIFEGSIFSIGLFFIRMDFLINNEEK